PHAAVGPDRPVVGAILARARLHGPHELGDGPAATVVRMDHVHHAVVVERDAAWDRQQLVHLLRPHQRAVGEIAPAADAGVALRFAEPLLVLACRGVAGPPGRDVLHDAAHAHRRGAAVVELAASEHAAHAAVGPDDPELLFERRA